MLQSSSKLVCKDICGAERLMTSHLDIKAVVLKSPDSKTVGAQDLPLWSSSESGTSVEHLIHGASVLALAGIERKLKLVIGA